MKKALYSSFNILFLIFLTTQTLFSMKAINSAPSQELTDLVRTVIPLRKTDGKIQIPAHIKHIKLDIGLSNNAPMSQYWLSHEDDLLVFGFEPNPTSVATIRQRHSDKTLIEKNFVLIPCALGLSTKSAIKFFVTSNDCGCSSLYFPKYFDIERTITVPIFSLATFFDLFPFDSHPVIEYIKIDAQGSDLNIAKSAGHYLAERVIYITLEAENQQYANTVNSLQDIENYMQSIGFVRYTAQNTWDPTYFNTRYTDYIKTHNVQIYQQG